jgi:hypothetical protein
MTCPHPQELWQEFSYAEGQTSTAQKGPVDVRGVVEYVHPEFTKMSVFTMKGILFFHEHMFWLNFDAP